MLWAFLELSEFLVPTESDWNTIIIASYPQVSFLVFGKM